MIQLSPQEIKQRLLAILVNFDELCRQNDLKMYLCAGTLLGAVRHHGFIPWDDDVDVCMDRESYDQLLEIAKQNQVFNGHYKIVDFQFGDSSYPFIKVVDLETQMSQQFERDQADYLWIDVFPMDGLPTLATQQRKLYRQVGIVREALMLSFAKAGEGRSMLRKTLKGLAIPFAKLYGLKRANRKLNQLAQSYDYHQTGLIGDVMWGEFGKEVLPVKDYFETTKVKFEHHQFDTMACWDQYLTMLYGVNYMELPPKSQRVNHCLQAWRR